MYVYLIPATTSVYEVDDPYLHVLEFKRAQFKQHMPLLGVIKGVANRNTIYSTRGPRKAKEEIFPHFRHRH